MSVFDLWDSEEEMLADLAAEVEAIKRDGAERRARDARHPTPPPRPSAPVAAPVQTYVAPVVMPVPLDPYDPVANGWGDILLPVLGLRINYAELNVSKANTPTIEWDPDLWSEFEEPQVV